MIRVAVNCLAGIAVAFLGSSICHAYSPVVGEPLADFVLPNIDNREAVALSQFRGKKVLLIQFASW